MISWVVLLYRYLLARSEQFSANATKLELGRLRNKFWYGLMFSPRRSGKLARNDRTLVGPGLMALTCSAWARRTSQVGDVRSTLGRQQAPDVVELTRS